MNIADFTLDLPHRILPFPDLVEDRELALHLYQPTCTGLEVREPGWFYDWSKVDSRYDVFLFKYTLAGTGFLEDLDAGRTYRLEPHEAFVIRTPGNYRYLVGSDEPWTFLWINTLSDSAGSLCSTFIGQNGPAVDLKGYPRPLEILSRIYHYRLENPHFDRFFVSSLVYDLIMSLLQIHRSPSAQIPVSILNACDFIEQSLDDPRLSIDDIARAAGYSKYHFIRKFKQHMKRSPHQYLIHRRLEKAVELITTTDLPIKIVSHRAGFINLSHFYSVFKKNLNFPPGTLSRPGH